MARLLKILVIIGLAVPSTVVAPSVVKETMVEETSGAEFCGGCHTMTPMVASYRADVHDGAGRQGVQAKCNQWHVPAGNAFV